jgi:hypothetical protein
MKDAGLLFLGPLSASSVAALGLALDSAVDIAFILVPEGCAVYEIGVRVTVATSADLFAVDFVQKPLAASTASDALIGTVTSAASQAADAVVRKFVNFDLNKGDLVRITVSNAGSTGAKGVPYLKAYPKGQSGAEAVDVASTT